MLSLQPFCAFSLSSVSLLTPQSVILIFVNLSSKELLQKNSMYTCAPPTLFIEKIIW